MSINQILGAFVALSVLLPGGYDIVRPVHASKSGTETTYGKPHAPVDIQYRVTNPTTSGFIGEPLSVEISLSNTVDVDDLLLSVRLGSGLQSSSLQAQYNFGVMPKNQLSVISFDVAASSAARYRIYITATVINSGKSQVRNIIMPLTIGDAPAVSSKPLDDVSVDSTGTAIISMPGTAVNSSNREGQ
jgi:hypothetical protein